MTSEQYRAEARRWRNSPFIPAWKDPVYQEVRKKEEAERQEQERLKAEQARNEPLSPEDEAFFAELEETEREMAKEKAMAMA